MSSDPSTEPLVTIGLPTFNRAKLLCRAVSSVQAQTYRNLDIVISDNGSTDETPAVCAAFRDRDPRIRLFRQATNVGPLANFAFVRKQARGEFFMWLSDDDWLSTNYVSACVSKLRRDNSYSLVSGRAEFVRDSDGQTIAANFFSLEQDSSVERIAEYYRCVFDNSVFYGVSRSQAAQEAPLSRMLGGDWLVVASLAAQGKVFMTQEASIHRRLREVTDGIQTTVRSLGLPRFHSWFPVASIAAVNAYGIVFKLSANSGLGVVSRIRLAFTVILTLRKRRGMMGRELTLWWRERKSIVLQRLHRALRPGR